VRASQSWIYRDLGWYYLAIICRISRTLNLKWKLVDEECFAKQKLD